MWHHCSSSDRLSTNRSDVRSPYAKNYRTNLTFDQREQLSHRQCISKLPRHEFEDRYIALLDEYYAIKKENAANNQKIKKMATKLLRLSAEGKSRGMPFPQQLAPNENLEIQIIRLEAYNSLLKDRLNAIIKKYSNCMRSTSTSTMRRPASCSNLSVKRKIILSENDLHLFDIPQPPTIVSKIDNRSSLESESAILYEKMPMSTENSPKKPEQPFHLNQPESLVEDNKSNIQENDPIQSTEHTDIAFKNIILKQEKELNEVKAANESMKQHNMVLEKRLATEENIELAELRRTMSECENELFELREQYLMLKTKAETDLNTEHKKIDKLTEIVRQEMDRNKKLSKDLDSLRQSTSAIYTTNANNSEKPEPKWPENSNMMDNNKNSNENEDLVELLNEAKLTIIQLQQELQGCLAENEAIRQQNQQLATQKEFLRNDIEVGASASENVDLKTLEPNTAVEDAKLQKTAIFQGAHMNNNIKQSVLQLNEDAIFSDKTFNLAYISSTDSEMSSLNSEDDFRIFQKKNRKLQSSMLLDSCRSTAMIFSQRLGLLEKIAYYRPLGNIISDANNARHHALPCNCSSVECDQQNEAFHEDIRKAVKNARSIMLQEIQTNPQRTNYQESEISFNQKLDNYDECREFLRVQYNINNLYKQELEVICQKYRAQKQNYLKQIEVLREKIQNANHSNQNRTEELENTSRLMYSDYEEGSFELHIGTFRPTKEGRFLLSCRHGELGTLFVSWMFFDCQLEAKTHDRLPPNYAFDTCCIYVVTINRTFLAHLQNDKLTMNLFTSTGSSSTLVGAAEISLSEVLLFPQNKIQLTAKVMSTSYECNHMDSFERVCGCKSYSNKPKHLGNLTLWFRLTCDFKILKYLFNEHLHYDSQGKQMEIEQSTAVANRDAEKWLFVVTIQCIKFHADFEVPKDTTDQVHLELNLLDNHRMKTDSKPFASEMLFNFTHKFSHSNRNIDRLTSLLRDSEQSIKFLLVSTMPKEPTLPYETKSDSIEIGFGLLHLAKIVNEWEDVANDSTVACEIPILSKTPPYQKIATLVVSIDEVGSLKTLQAQL